MLRALIVDDEFIVRAGLINCINWKKLNLKLIGEASNGQEALDIILRDRPDIILLDLLMPGMSGMELIQKLEDLKIKTNIIILSCHEDYNYVRDAFKKGVQDYILKLSATPDEITAIISDVSKKIMMEQCNSQLTDSTCSPLPLSSLSAPEQCVSNNTNYYLIGLYGPPMKSDRRDSLIQLLFQWVKHNACAGGRLFPSLVDQTKPALLYIENSAECSQKCAEQHILHSTALLQEFLQTSCADSVLLGISGLCPASTLVGRALRESLKALDLLFYDTSQHVGFYSRLKELYNPGTDIPHSSFYQDIKALLCCRSFETLQDKVETRLNQAWAQKTDPRIIKLESIDLINSLGNYLREQNMSLGDIDEEYLCFYQDIAKIYSFSALKDYLNTFFDKYFKFLEMQGKKNIRSDIADVLKFIETHYNTSLTLSDIADYINISKNHLSYLFRKETGQTFSDYLINFRIAKAKQFLDSNCKYSISEIANKTGFSDTGYFCKVFKKTTGISPNRYKQGGSL